MDDLNFEDMEDPFDEEMLNRLSDSLKLIADSNPSINEIMREELHEDSVRMHLASNLVSATDAADSSVRYRNQQDDLCQILSSLHGSVAHNNIGITRLLMAMHNQQKQMLQYMNESNTYLAVIMKRMEDVTASCTNRGLGSEEQNKKSSD